MFEIFEHTADVGLRVRAADLDELFAEAGRGLFSLLVENIENAQAESTDRIALEADSLEDLFHDWLSDLLYYFDRWHRVLCRFSVRVRDRKVEAVVAGEEFDPSKHRTGPEIKAITYHLLAVRKIQDGWEAEVIVDI